MEESVLRLGLLVPDGGGQGESVPNDAQAASCGPQLRVCFLPVFCCGPHCGLWTERLRCGEATVMAQGQGQCGLQGLGRSCVLASFHCVLC